MSFIDYIEARHDVHAVSGGRQLKLSGPCPFCGEDRRDLRLYVNPETELGDCKHCGTVFGPIKFIMASEGCTAKEAEAIAEGNGDGFAREKQGRPAEPAIPFPTVKSIAETEAAKAYLEGRRIGPELVEHFDLSYCIANIEAEGKTLYTKGRIIIPIHDFTGKLKSWQGRDITGKSSMRYLFPPSFKGAEFLYNAHNIKYNPDYLIVVEGVFDAFGWFRAGFKNVVATFGKKISKAQIDIIRSINPKAVFIAWDSDAMDKKYQFMEQYGYLWTIKMVDLGGKDADETEKDDLIAALVNSRFYSWEDKILSTL